MKNNSCCFLNNRFYHMARATFFHRRFQAENVAVKNVKRLLQKEQCRGERLLLSKIRVNRDFSVHLIEGRLTRESLNTFSIAISRIRKRAADGRLFIHWLSLIDLYCVAYTLLAMPRERGRRTESETRAQRAHREGPLLFQTNDPLIGPSFFPILLSHASRLGGAVTHLAESRPVIDKKNRNLHSSPVPLRFLSTVNFF